MSTIIQKVNAIVDLLNTQKIDNATAYRVDGRFHAWEILKNKPGTAKIAVGFQSARRA